MPYEEGVSYALDVSNSFTTLPVAETFKKLYKHVFISKIKSNPKITT